MALYFKNLFKSRPLILSLSCSTSYNKKSKPNPFFVAPIEDLLKLGSKMNSFNNPKFIIFYTRLCQAVVMKSKDHTISKEVQKALEQDLSRVLSQLGQLLNNKSRNESSDTVGILMLANSVLQGAAKKIYYLKNKELNSFLPLFEKFVAENAQLDTSGRYYNVFMKLFPTLLSMRKGFTCLEKIFNYLVEACKTDEQILNVFSMINESYFRSTHYFSLLFVTSFDKMIKNWKPIYSHRQFLKFFLINEYYRKLPYANISKSSEVFLKKIQLKYKNVEFKEKGQYLNFFLKLWSETLPVTNIYKLDVKKLQQLKNYLFSYIQQVEQSSDILRKHQLCELIPTFATFMKKYNFLFQHSSNQMIKQILQNLFKKFIFKLKLQNSVEKKLCLAFLKHLIRQKVDLPSQFKDEICSFFLFFLKNGQLNDDFFVYYEWVIKIFLEKKDENLRKNIIEVTEKFTENRNFKSFQILRLYHLMNLISYKNEEIFYLYPETLQKNISIFSNTLSMGFMKPYFTQYIIKNYPKNEKFMLKLDYILSSLKNRQTHDYIEEEKIIQFIIKNKSNDLRDGMVSMESWTAIYQHYRFSFYDAKFLELQFGFQCMKLAVFSKNLSMSLWEQIYFWLLRDRKIIDIYFHYYDAIFEIKYLNFVQILEIVKLNQSIAHESIMNIFHGIIAQKKSKLKFFQSIYKRLETFSPEDVKDRKTFHLEKIILWAQANDIQKQVLPIACRHFKFVQLISYFIKNYDLLQILNFYESLGRRQENAEKLKDLTELNKNPIISKILQFYNGQISCQNFTNEEILKIWSQKGLMKKVPRESLEDALKRLLNINHDLFHYEKFFFIANLVLCILDESLLGKYNKQINEWISSNFVYLTRFHNSSYFQDYLVLAEKGIQIPSYKENIIFYYENEIKRGNIYLFDDIYYNKIQLSHDSIHKMLEKMQRRNFWHDLKEIFYKDFFQLFFTNVYGYVLFLKDAELMEKFIDLVLSTHLLKAKFSPACKHRLSVLGNLGKEFITNSSFEEDMKENLNEILSVFIFSDEKTLHNQLSNKQRGLEPSVQGNLELTNEKGISLYKQLSPYDRKNDQFYFAFREGSPEERVLSQLEKQYIQLSLKIKVHMIRVE